MAQHQLQFSIERLLLSNILINRIRNELAIDKKAYFDMRVLKDLNMFRMAIWIAVKLN